MFPDLALELTAETSLKLFEHLRSGDIDLALIMGPVLESSYVSIELCTFACHWVASPALSFPPGPIGLEDLARHPVISFPKDSQPHGHITRFFKQHPQYEARLKHPRNLRWTGTSVATVATVA